MRRARKRVVRWLGAWLGPLVVVLYVRLVHGTSRVEILDVERYEHLWKEERGCVVAFWHGRLLMVPPMLRQGFEVSALVSRHGDGEIIAKALARFGVRSVRGSTTRGGFRGLHELVRRAKAGEILAITPDGPRGPAEVVKPGVVEAARLAGVPIVPVSYGASRAAHIGISLPGTGETPAAPVFVDGEKVVTLRGDNIAAEFKAIVDNYIATRYVKKGA